MPRRCFARVLLTLPALRMALNCLAQTSGTDVEALVTVRALPPQSRSW